MNKKVLIVHGVGEGILKDEVYIGNLIQFKTTTVSYKNHTKIDSAPLIPINDDSLLWIICAIIIVVMSLIPTIAAAYTIKNYKEVLNYIDVLVDGKYIDKLRDVSLQWRGSSNQRVIDVKQTLQKGEIVLWAT